MKVIIDFDNTFYTENRDIDDGLALIYLLGSQIEPLAITSTFGNSNIETVHKDTVKLMTALNINHIPYAKGASKIGDYLNDASRLLASVVKEFPNQVSILATGSMTNLFGASLIHPNFFKEVKEIVIMGGTTAPLLFAKQEMLELNLSIDPQASFGVLTETDNLSIITGNTCLSLLFTRQQYQEKFAQINQKIVEMIHQHSDPWFDDNDQEYGIPGYYNWDTLAAAYLVNPDLFIDQPTPLSLSINGLSTGSLKAKDKDPSTYATSRPYREKVMNLPQIKNKEALSNNIYATWLQLDLD